MYYYLGQINEQLLFWKTNCPDLYDKRFRRVAADFEEWCVENHVDLVLEDENAIDRVVVPQNENAAFAFKMRWG